MPAEPFPVLSIITPVRNDISRLRRTAISIASQTSKRFEWIVVDNLSTDGTVDLMRDCNMAAKQFVSEPDEGLYDGMNKGLKLARGRFVQFINAGDTFTHDGAVDRLCGELDRIPETVDMVLVGAYEIYLNGRRSFRAPPDCVEAIRHRLPACHQAVIVRKNRHLEVPFDTSYRVAADYAVFARLHRNGAFCVAVPVPLVIFAIDHKSVTYRHPLRLVREYAKVQREILCVPFSRRLISGAMRAVSIGSVYLMAVGILQGLALRILAKRTAHHREGRGAERGPVEAATPYQTAPEQDKTYARCGLSEVYRIGEGVERDLETAKHWHRPAARKGDHLASERLTSIDGASHENPREDRSGE